MFAGKTSELIHRLETARRRGQDVVAFKHAIDRRFSSTEIVSHDGLRLPAESVRSAGELVSRIGAAVVVGVDEGQFFDDDFAAACAQLLAAGKRVIVAGLDLTCLGDPFDPVPALCAAAHEVTRLRARCARCGEPATFTQRLIADADTDADAAREKRPLLVGGAEAYEPRCEACFAPVNRRRSSDAPAPPDSRCER